MQHQSVCVFFSDKNETAQGSLQYQRLYSLLDVGHSASGKASCCFVISFPLLVCKWTADTDWWAITHLVLFCCRFLAASLILLAPFALVWQGHTTLQSSLICLFICTNRWTISARAPVTLAWWQGNIITLDHYWVNREATDHSIMLPFIFPTNILPSWVTYRQINQDKWHMARVEERAWAKWQRDNQWSKSTWRQIE